MVALSEMRWEFEEFCLLYGYERGYRERDVAGAVGILVSRLILLFLFFIFWKWVLNVYLSQELFFFSVYNG